jgi:hypothetical protein
MPRTMSAKSTQHVRTERRRAEHTIDVAKPTSLALLRVVEPAGPIDSDIAFPTIQPRSTFHATTRTNATELEKAVKYRTIVTNVEAALLFLEVLHVIRGYSL